MYHVFQPFQFFFFYSEWWNFVDSSFNVVQFVYYVSISYWWRNNVHNIYCLFPKLLICTNSSLTLVSWRQHFFFQSFLWCLKFGVGTVEQSTREIALSFSFSCYSSSDAVISSTILWSLKCSYPGPSALNQSFISVIIQMYFLCMKTTKKLTRMNWTFFLSVFLSKAEYGFLNSQNVCLRWNIRMLLVRIIEKCSADFNFSLYFTSE